MFEVGVMNMKLPPFQLAALDMTAGMLLVFDGPSGKILTEIPYPKGFTPMELAVHPFEEKIFLPSNGEKGMGALFIAHLGKGYLYQLPLVFPFFSQFALAPDASAAYFADGGGQLYQLDLHTAALTPWGRTECACCVGLAAGTDAVYTVWEYGNRGFLAIFDPLGNLCSQHLLPAIPTNIRISRKGHLLIPVTSNEPIGEGLLHIKVSPGDNRRPIQVHYFMYTDKVSLNTAYPCYVALSPEEHLIYLVNEDLPSIALLDLEKQLLLRQIRTPYALTCLQVLPEGAYCLAASFDSPELLLMDLLDGSLVCTTHIGRKLLPYIAILPLPPSL